MADLDSQLARNGEMVQSELSAIMQFTIRDYSMAEQSSTPRKSFRGGIPMPSNQQIESFYEFASSQIVNGGAELSMDELYCLWRAKHPTPEELANSVAAIRAAYAEMEGGDSGRPARMALRESCQRLGLVIDE